MVSDARAFGQLARRMGQSVDQGAVGRQHEQARGRPIEPPGGISRLSRRPHPFLRPSVPDMGRRDARTVIRSGTARLELLHEVDVGLLGIVRRRATKSFPGVVLRTAHEVHHPGPISFDVT